MGPAGLGMVRSSISLKGRWGRVGEGERGVEEGAGFVDAHFVHGFEFLALLPEDLEHRVEAAAVDGDGRAGEALKDRLGKPF